MKNKYLKFIISSMLIMTMLIISIIPCSAISAPSPEYNWTYYVYTPGGRVAVTAGLLITADFDSSEQNYYKSYVETNYYGSTVIDPASYKYNCHAFAWYSTSSSNNYWINKYPPTGTGAYAFWQNGNGYALIGTSVSGSAPAGALGGDKIVYENDDHSALYYSSGTDYVTAKWGGLGVVRHYYNISPYNHFYLSYYKYVGL